MKRRLTLERWEEQLGLLRQYLEAESEYEAVMEHEYLQPIEVWALAVHQRQRAIAALREFQAQPRRQRIKTESTKESARVLPAL